MSDKKENDKKKDEINNKNNNPKIEYTKKVGNYIITEQIGVGTFSKVTKAIHILTGEAVAVKILDKSKIKDEIDIERISREIEILKSISHPNISQLYESNSTIHNFYLIMEYIEGGDLCDYINKNISLDEHTSCRFFRQLISAIEYLCDMGITHRDLKPENILLDNSQQNIKVIDFGLSNYCTDSELLQSACGSPCFASPEMLSGNPYNGITTDIWSSGIVLYSMLVGTLPFDDQELNDLYEQIKIGTFYIPSTLSLEAIDFLKKILQVEPNKRMNLKQIKEHPWFNIEKNQLYKGIDLTVETFPYDEDLIEFVIKRYFANTNIVNKNNFIKMIQYHACNQYTATYYLTEKFLKKLENKLSKEDLNIIDKEQIISVANTIDSGNQNEIGDEKNDETIKNNNDKETIVNNNDKETIVNNKYKETIVINKDKETLVNDKDKETLVNNKSNENIVNDNNEDISNNNNNNKKDSKKVLSIKEKLDIKNKEKNDNNKDSNYIKKKIILKNKDKLNNTKEIKTKKNSRSNSTNNKIKNKNLIIDDFNNENKKINLIKKEIISYKKSPYNINNKKNSFINNKMNLLQNAGEIKLTHGIKSIIDNLRMSENNSKIKNKEHLQKKEKENYIIKKYKKEQNKNLFDNKKVTRNYFKAQNFKTEYHHKKFENNSLSLNFINTNRYTVSFRKKPNTSLTDRGIIYNSIFDEPKIESNKKNKIQSIKTEKINQNKIINISSINKRNNSNNSQNKKKIENNSINITNKNYIIKKEKKYNKKNIDLSVINQKKNKKFSNFNFNKNKKNMNIQTNMNNIFYNFSKLNSFINNYTLTESNQDKKDLKLNKIKLQESSHSLLHMKKKYFETKNIKSYNKNEYKTYNTINKYKDLLDEFKVDHSEHKNKKNKFNNFVNLGNEYFSINHKIEEKIKFKKRNKNSILINPSTNISLSKTNNLSNYNINTLNQNYNKMIEEINNKIKSKLTKSSLKNKKNLTINSGKYKVFLPLKYKKNNLRLNINSTNSDKINNISGTIIKNNLNRKNNNINRKESLNKKNISSYIKTQKNRENSKLRNLFSPNLSISPKNNNIKPSTKTSENNKKIINININNILKINRKYSISLTKSNESSKNNINHNNTEISENKNLFNIKSNNSSYSLANNKISKYKDIIKYNSNNNNSNNNSSKNKNSLIYLKINNELKRNKNYSSMLKRQLFEEQLINKTKNI